MDRIPSETQLRLETTLRQLYGVYLYLRDHDLSEKSNTSRLLHEKNHSYLVSRLADELQELAGVQSGEHVHAGKQDDTVLEGSQVSYWLFLLAVTHDLRFDNFAPHRALLKGYCSQYGEEAAVELHQECLQFLATDQSLQIRQGLKAGFSYVGWACATAEVSPLAPAEFDLAQMRRKGILQ
jgi:phosphoribosyl-ATP pyrophosphohydrolase